VKLDDDDDNNNKKNDSLISIGLVELFTSTIRKIHLHWIF